MAHSQLTQTAAWEMPNRHKEKEIFNESGCMPQKDAQTGLKSPSVKMLNAQLGKALSNLFSFDSYSTLRLPEVPSNLKCPMNI